MKYWIMRWNGKAWERVEEVKPLPYLRAKDYAAELARFTGNDYDVMEAQKEEPHRSLLDLFRAS